MPMKKIYGMYVVLLLLVGGGNMAGAQVYSTQVSYSPSTSTLIDEATRYGYQANNWSTFYMRYGDTSYLCEHMVAGLWAPGPVYYVVPMPQDFVVKKMKRTTFLQGFIGSYGGLGMHGRIATYPISTVAPCNVYIFQMPAVDCLERVAHATLPYASPGARIKAFSTGGKAIAGTYSSQSYLVGFYADGAGTSFLTYQYVPLAINTSTGECEVADDVITFDDRVIYATRDTRIGHAPINLRITDTSGSLMGSHIDVQWQIPLGARETLYDKVRLQYIGKDHFVVLYVVYNEVDNQYYLCYHRIMFMDLISGNNTVVSHEIPIEKGVDLTDVIYEPDVNVMVILMNGEKSSELYHVNPFSNISDYAYRVDYINGNLYTIDTIGGTSSFPNADCYIAMGGGELFYQDISGGYVISQSCMPITQSKAYLKRSPVIVPFVDAVNRYTGTKNVNSISKNVRLDEGTLSCVIY